MPSIRTRWPGSTSAQPYSGARTSSGPDTRHRRAGQIQRVGVGLDRYPRCAGDPGRGQGVRIAGHGQFGRDRGMLRGEHHQRRRARLPQPSGERDQHERDAEPDRRRPLCRRRATAGAPPGRTRRPAPPSPPPRAWSAERAEGTAPSPATRPPRRSPAGHRSCVRRLILCRHADDDRRVCTRSREQHGRRPRRHIVTSGLSWAKRTSPIPDTSCSWSMLANCPCAVAPVEDVLAEHRPHAGQRLQLLERGGVEIDDHRRRATSRPRRPSPAAHAPPVAAAGVPDHDLLAVAQRLGEVERERADPWTCPAGGPDRVVDPRAGRQFVDARARDLARHVDDDRHA